MSDAGNRRDLLEGQDVRGEAVLIAQVSSWFGALCVPVAALRGYASESFERVILDLVDEERTRSDRGLRSTE